jgi:hypothetical protein
MRCEKVWQSKKGRINLLTKKGLSGRWRNLAAELDAYGEFDL